MILKDVRFSYCNVFEARPTPGGDLKFSVCVLVPKKDTGTVNAIKGAVYAATKLGVEKGNFTAPQSKSPMFKLPLRDGDAEHKAGTRGPEFKNMHFFNAASKNRPGVVGPDASSPILDSEEFYSGVWGHIDVNFYPFPSKGANIPSQGIAAGLNNIMKVKDDDRLDGRMRAEDAFDGMSEETPPEPNSEEPF